MRFNTTKVIYSALCLISVLLTACGSGGGGGAAATSAAPTIAPRFAYAANFNDGTVSMYTVNAATGQLRHNGYVVAGVNPISVTVDPRASSPTWRIAAITASRPTPLVPMARSRRLIVSVACNATNFATGSSPWSVTIDPSGKFAYVANSGSNDRLGLQHRPPTGRSRRYFAGLSPLALQWP